MSFYDVTTLDNGLTIYSETVSNVRSAALGFWVAVGSRYENDDNNGVSHFIEHMLFKGTERHSAKDICETFESLGAELNAFTTKEFTCFYSRLIDEHLDVGAEILSDMVQNPMLKEEHIDFERQVILEEIAMYEDTPDEQIHDLFTASLWPNHPLGRQVLGDKKTVGGFNRRQLLDFFKTHYYPANIIVTAAGNIKHEDIVTLIKKHYPAAGKGSKVDNQQPVRAQSKLRIFNKPTEQVHLCYGTTTINANHPDRFALAILENIIGGGMSSRLFQKIREEKGLVYSVFSYHTLYQETGNLTVYAGTRKANMNQVLEIISAEFKLIAASGVTKAEFIRAREHLKGRLVLGLESVRNRMTRLGKSALIHEEILSADELIAKIMKVNQDDVQRLAVEFLQPGRLVLTIIGPVTAADVEAPVKFAEVIED